MSSVSGSEIHQFNPWNRQKYLWFFRLKDFWDSKHTPYCLCTSMTRYNRQKKRNWTNKKTSGTDYRLSDATYIEKLKV